jgi:hypothetical protein
MNVGVPDRKIFGELCVPAEMLRAGRTGGGFPGPSAIGIAAFAPHAAACANGEHEHNRQLRPGLE